jgi:hypothetical protein
VSWSNPLLKACLDVFGLHALGQGHQAFDGTISELAVKEVALLGFVGARRFGTASRSGLLHQFQFLLGKNFQQRTGRRCFPNLSCPLEAVETTGRKRADFYQSPARKMKLPKAKEKNADMRLSMPATLRQSSETLQTFAASDIFSHNVGAARLNARTSNRQDRGQCLAPQVVLFTRTQPGNSLPGTYRLKKAAQPEELASARLMPTLHQYRTARLRRSETGQTRYSGLWQRTASPGLRARRLSQHPCSC